MCPSVQHVRKTSPNQEYQKFETYERFIRREEISVALRLGNTTFNDIKTANEYRLQDGYHNQANSYYGRVAISLPRLPEVQSGGTILDVGCATGLTTIELANHYSDCRVVGIELRWYLKEFINNSVAQSRSQKSYLIRHTPPHFRRMVNFPPKPKVPCDFVMGDAFTYAGPHAPADVVFVMNSLYYSAMIVPQHVLNLRVNQIKGLVKEGGLLVLTGALRRDEDGVDSIISYKKRGKMKLLEVNNGCGKSSGPVILSLTKALATK